MNIEQAQAALAKSNRPETWTIVYERPAKLRAAHRGLDVKKVSVIKSRFVNYGNKKVIKEGHANGTITPNPNNWQRVSKGIFLDHKGKHKLCFDVSRLKGRVTTSQWLVNGAPKNKEEIEEYLLGSETKKGDSKPPEWLTLDLAKVVDIIPPSS